MHAEKVELAKFEGAIGIPTRIAFADHPTRVHAAQMYLSRAEGRAQVAAEDHRHGKERRRAKACASSSWSKTSVTAPKSNLRIPIKLYPKQQLLWKLLDESGFTHIGYGGSRGGGKSQGVRNVVLRRAMKYPGTEHLIFRKTSKELWKNHILKLFQQYPGTRAWYNFQRQELTLPNSSLIRFGYAERKGEIYDFQGDGYATIAVDEATQSTEEDLTFLRTCLRYVGPLAVVPKMIYTMNPGGRGHTFIKRVFIDRDYTANEHAADYAFIQSYCWDNVGWCQEELTRDQITQEQYYRQWSDNQRLEYFIGRTHYGREMNALPETERLQLLMGDWEIFEGQFFGEYRRDLHQLRPFRIPDFWERFAAADWGYSSPACNLWMAVSPDEWYQVGQPNGRVALIPPRSVIVYKESYQRKLDNRQLAEEWNRINGADQLRYRVLDPAFGPTRGGGVSVAEELGGAGWSTIPGDNDRLQGWSRVRQYLSWKRDQAGKIISWPHLFIFDTCANLCRTLPQLIHDEIQVEDVDSEGEDHAPDALRYGLMTRPPLTIVPLEELSEEYAEAALRAIHEEKYGTRRGEPSEHYVHPRAA
jgi:phage terminase large subunit